MEQLYAATLSQHVEPTGVWGPKFYKKVAAYEVIFPYKNLKK